jgi:hypothetical protein
MVSPANSVGFSPGANCDFYRFAWQMFLWLTSPVPAPGGGRTFNSDTFFDVTPPDVTGFRRLIQASALRPLTSSVRVVKHGPHDLPVVFARSGQSLEIERPGTIIDARIRVRDTTGHLIEVAHAKRAENGALMLSDKAGAVIKTGAPLPRRPTEGPAQVQVLFVDNVPIVMDNLGNIVDPGASGDLIAVEQQQATGSANTPTGPVLTSNKGSLVYYGIMVNDVYAYFLTGWQSAVIQLFTVLDLTHFPQSTGDQTEISNFVNQKNVNKQLADLNALAVEIKTSWVEADKVSDPNTYITANAVIPVYQPSKNNSHEWLPMGVKTTQLALVGMHVVGSAAGHPEMIWATFEHDHNTPNVTYAYTNNKGAPRQVTQDATCQGWLFCVDGFDISKLANPTGVNQPIQPIARLDNSGHIVAVGNNPIGNQNGTLIGSNIIREKPWGAVKLIGGEALLDSNSEIIAINFDVRSLLKQLIPPNSGAPDVRSNYFLVGATWTDGSPPSKTTTLGVDSLANTTIETFVQGTPLTQDSLHCFGCHTGPGVTLTPGGRTLATTSVSHIFAFINPLF